MPLTIYTAQSHPDHSVIGHYFKVWDGGLAYCDSWDPRIGYWMTWISPDDGTPTGVRRNVSERAIDRTFHTIYFYLPYEMLNLQNKELFRVIEAHKAIVAEEAKSLPPLPPKDVYAVNCVIETWHVTKDLEIPHVRHWKGTLYIPAFFERDAYHEAIRMVERSDAYSQVEVEKGHNRNAKVIDSCMLSPEAVAGLDPNLIGVFQDAVVA